MRRMILALAAVAAMAGWGASPGMATRAHGGEWVWDDGGEDDGGTVADEWRRQADEWNRRQDREDRQGTDEWSGQYGDESQRQRNAWERQAEQWNRQQRNEPERRRDGLNPSIVIAEYPEQSLRRGESGTVVVESSIDIAGRVRDVRIVETSGFPDLDEAAADAVRNGRFEPDALKRDRRIERHIIVFGLQ